MEKVKAQAKGAYLGISLHDPDFRKLQDVEDKVDKHFAIVGIYQAWGTKNNRFDAQSATNFSGHNSIPLITWEPWVPISGYDRSEDLAYQEKYSLKNISDGKFDKYISTYAADIKKYKGQVMIRFAHEMNGNWYSWGSSFNTPEEYIAAWRHVHGIFTRTGATNVTWVWSPNEIYESNHVPYSNQILRFYPGDEYVDWVGFSSFNWAGQYKQNFWREPDSLFSPTLGILTELKKPIMITETASAETSAPTRKARWIISLSNYVKENPRIKGVIWFNTIDNGIDWRIESNPSSVNAFRSVFSDNYFIKK